MSGFTNVECNYIFSILPLTVFLFRSFPIKLGLKRKSSDLEKHKNEHQQKKGIINKILQKIWNLELSILNSNKKIPLEGSCFVIEKNLKETQL